VAIEESFWKLHGRQPTDKERQWLLKVQGALGLRENDAFWFVVMMLEHYDGLYRDYPRKIAEETSRTIDGTKKVLAVAARMEAARALAEELAKTSAEIAQKLAERPHQIHRITAALAFLVLFGSICMSAGFKLATTGRPFWVSAEGPPRVASVVLGAPAGWMSFALLLPTAAYVFRRSWADANKEHKGFREAVVAWIRVVIAAVAAIACAVMIAWMV
jgi:hypothetical protein